MRPSLLFSLFAQNHDAMMRVSSGPNEIIQIIADDVPPSIAQFSPQRPLRLLPKG